jgi:two-component system cell cycle response regulator
MKRAPKRKKRSIKKEVLPDKAKKGFGNLLIIEDRLDTLFLLSQALHSKGYTIYESTTGKAGLNQLKKHKVDLVILDLLLPDMHGEEVLKKIRANKKYDDVKVVILTAVMLSPKEKKEFLSKGVDGVLLKPISISTLAEEIKCILCK